VNFVQKCTKICVKIPFLNLGGERENSGKFYNTISRTKTKGKKERKRKRKRRLGAKLEILVAPELGPSKYGENSMLRLFFRLLLLSSLLLLLLFPFFLIFVGIETQ